MRLINGSLKYVDFTLDNIQLFVNLFPKLEYLKIGMKKEEIYEIIEKMYPTQKYIELFARNDSKRKNWIYWGNESN